MNNYLISKLTNLCLYALICIAIADIFSNFMQINLMNDYFIGNLYSPEIYDVLAEKNDDRVDLIHTLYSLVIFSCWAIIGRWVYVSAKINHLSGRNNLKFRPGWAVGWYLIPVANLVMPYLSLRETFRASFSLNDWEVIKVPFDFPIWWITFWVGNILANISYRMVLSPGDSYTYIQLNQIAYLDITQDILLVISAFFLIRIVKIIFENQKDKNF